MTTWFAMVLWLAVDAGATPVDVRLDTTEGAMVVRVHPDWAPRGAARFLELVEAGVYDGAPFFRVVKGFIAQVGIPVDPAVAAQWESATIEDDPVRQSNLRGRVTFATSGPGRRTTQVFINLADNPSLDRSGFAPFAEVIDGLDVADHLFHRYGDAPPAGRGPDQRRLRAEGEPYLARFRKLDRIERATVLP